MASGTSLRGDAVADRPRHGLVGPGGPADAEGVGVPEAAVPLALLPLETEVGDPVLAAAVGAVRHADLEMLLEAGRPGLEIRDQPVREALGLGQRDLAELAARAADRAHAIALRVDPPPAEMRVEPFRRDGVPALAREALDLGIRGPGVERCLEPLRPLRLGFLARLDHACLQAERPSK